MVDRLRRTGFGDFACKSAIVVLFALLSTNLFQEFVRTGHVTGLLLLASESLVVVLTLARRRAAVIDSSAKAATVTVVSLVGPWLLRTGDAAALSPDVFTTMISATGLAVVVASKIALGRSFGLVPANRGVVVRGPYGFVRHPIYLGYLVTHVAYFFAHPTMWNAAVIIIGDGTLIARALMEERVLQRDAAYAAYCRRVSWHLMPGVF
jgi:protein-S-isoprenylcysteine O-methyltransferase Ste14